MEVYTFSLLILFAEATRPICDSTRAPIELGEWNHFLTHMDTATIENPPVSVKEGQIYVYDNYFPNQTIKYIHVDNLATHSCGASAAVKAGGIDTPGVLIVLQSNPHQEIRSIIDIWGAKKMQKKFPLILPEELKALKSQYLFNGPRAINHNFRNTKNKV